MKGVFSRCGGQGWAGLAAAESPSPSRWAGTGWLRCLEPADTSGGLAGGLASLCPPVLCWCLLWGARREAPRPGAIAAAVSWVSALRHRAGWALGLQACRGVFGSKDSSGTLDLRFHTRCPQPW